MVHFEVYSTGLASGSVLLLIAVTRYTKVCRPMQPGLSKRQARLLCVLIVAVAMAVCTITFVIKGLEKVKIAMGERDYVPPVSGNGTGWRGLLQPAVGVVNGSRGASSSPPWNALEARSESSPGLNRVQNSSEFLDGRGVRASLDGDRMAEAVMGGSDGGRGNTSDNSTGPRAATRVVEVVEVYICRTAEEHGVTALHKALLAVFMTAFVGIFFSLLVLHCRISVAVSRFEQRQTSMRRISVLSDAENQSGTHITASMFRIFATITLIFFVSYLPHLLCLIVERSAYPAG